MAPSIGPCRVRTASYNEKVARTLILLALLTVAQHAAGQPPKRPTPVVIEPDEEDESSKPKEYTLNPLQAETEINIGNFYAKKGSYNSVDAKP